MKKLDWYELDVPEKDGVYAVVLKSKMYSLVVQHGDIYVLSKRCPHAGADLSQGWCEDHKLVCPFHRHKFDLVSGRGDPGQGNYINSYATKLEGGQWYVGFPKSWWKNLF